MLAPVESVAILALIYKVMHRDCYGGPESLFDDLDSYPDGLSLIGMVGSQMLTEGDWDIVALIEKLYSPCSLAQELDSQNPLRCEAMLHAWPNDPLDELANADWAQRYLARWPPSNDDGRARADNLDARGNGRRRACHRGRPLLASRTLGH